MKKVMIVDDAAFMRLYIKNILTKNGFEVVAEAVNGADGVEKYKSASPDIVTMDVTMDVMTGIEALTAIKAYDPNAKVIMVSAMGQEKMVKEAVIKGAKSFIVKPFKDEHLVNTLNKLLG